MREREASLVTARFLRSELAAELYCDEVLAGDGSPLYVDRVLSMGALSRADADAFDEVIDRVFALRAIHKAPE